MSFGTHQAATTVDLLAPFRDGLTYIGIAVAVVGIGLAWLMYGVETLPKTLFTGNPVGAFVYRVLLNKYYIDELYGAIIKYIVLGISKLAELFDMYVIDGIVNGSARVVRGLGRVGSRSETGLLQNYGAAFFGGVMVILIIVIVVVGAPK
jgi:NADH-quinone oxidoreductase subunit L